MQYYNAAYNRLLVLNNRGGFTYQDEFESTWRPALDMIATVPVASGVLVFCEHGAHRSPGFCLGLLVGATGVPPARVASFLQALADHVT